MQLEVGAILEGKVTGIAKFGAFVSFPEGKSGLIHISEVANTYVNDIHEFLSEGQNVKVRVVSISPEGKIGLSMKNTEQQPPQTAAKPAYHRSEAKPAPIAQPRERQYYVPTRSEDQNFEDKLKQFMQEADSRMSGNKLYEQQRRSRSRRK